MVKFMKNNSEKFLLGGIILAMYAAAIFIGMSFGVCL
jgi:hypothetical protein